MTVSRICLSVMVVATETVSIATTATAPSPSRSQGDPAQDSSGDHIGAAAADYDNDGNLDLVVTSGVGAPSAQLTILYHNEGNGTFTRVSGGAVTNQPGFFGPCTWADFDRDGFVDLFVANHGDQNDGGGKNRLFRNNGDGTFTRITEPGKSSTIPAWPSTAYGPITIMTDFRSARRQQDLQRIKFPLSQQWQRHLHPSTDGGWLDRWSREPTASRLGRLQ